MGVCESPCWHELDGGRYIGTAPLVITRDPDTGEVNVGRHRVMVHDERTRGVQIATIHGGYARRARWFARGEPCLPANGRPRGHRPARRWRPSS
jgi:4-hydroxy-3-polyprenylbenzoate decarboxylase